MEHVDTDEILGLLKREQKSLTEILRLIQETKTLSQDSVANLAKIKAKLEQLRRLTDVWPSSTAAEPLRAWISQSVADITRVEDQAKYTLGTDLEPALKAIGLNLVGQYPEFQIGLFTLVLNIETGRAQVWFGRQQELLGDCRLVISEVVTHIKRVEAQLGSQLTEEDFMKRLRVAYNRLAKGHQGETVPIIGVLAELAFILQPSKFQTDPRAENYQPYSRADFSYDLFRLHRTHPAELRLVIATREATRSRSGFLWVPENESGKGSVFSHVQIKENPS